MSRPNLRRKRSNPWRYSKNGALRLPALRRAGLSGEWHMVSGGMDGEVDVPREFQSEAEWLAWSEKRSIA